MKVLVCDDEQTRFDDVAAELSQCGVDSVEVVRLVGKELTVELERLFDRVRSCIDDPKSYAPQEELVFDGADLAIFDNNLSQLDIRGSRLTGESVVGYVRCFSRVPYVVSLNKNPDVDFDLRFLIGDYETRADLALNTEHLSNNGLWNGQSATADNGFRPWYWPILAQAPGQRREQIAFVLKHLDDAVLASFGFPTDEESLGFLSLHAKGALSPEAGAVGGDDGKPIAEVTFRDVFMAGSRSLPAKEEREALNGGSTAGNRAVDELLARVAAADIDRWFRRDVLGPQEMLVDVPHLLVRMPFLLGKRASDAGGWNEAIAVREPPFAMDKGLFDQHVADATFGHPMWIPVPAFWWPTLKKNDQLGELFFAETEPNWADVVFCEDTSTVVDRAEHGKNPPMEFAAEFEGSWGRRHVAKLEGVRYAPRSRFAV